MQNQYFATWPWPWPDILASFVICNTYCIYIKLYIIISGFARKMRKLNRELVIKCLLTPVISHSTLD